MSNYPTITGNSGYGDQADKSFAQFKAGEDIDKGAPVYISTVADDGITVLMAKADTPMVGIATEDADEGAFFKAQTKGFCEYILTDGGVTSGQMLIPGTDVCDSVAIGSADAAEAWVGFGIALADDASTVLSAAWIDCFGS